jgi:hypothetical protein
VMCRRRRDLPPQPPGWRPPMMASAMTGARPDPDHPRLVRLMRSCRMLSDPDPSADGGARSDPDAPR